MSRFILAVVALSLSACWNDEEAKTEQEIATVQNAMSSLAQACQDAVDIAATYSWPERGPYCVTAVLKLMKVPLSDPDYLRLAAYYKQVCKPPPADAGTPADGGA